MEPFVIVLMLATLLVTLVAGFLVAFALIVMPGIAQLDDRAFVQAFQAMDAIIQRRHPGFMVLWLGSVVALLLALLLGFSELERVGRTLIVSAVSLFVFGVQLPTAVVNIPLNNGLQALDLKQMDDGKVHEARWMFEQQWNRWNIRRTVAACAAAAVLIAMLGTLS